MMAVTGVLGWAWRVIATDERSGSGCIKRVDESWEEGSHRPSGLPSLFGRVPQGFIRGAGGLHPGLFSGCPSGTPARGVWSSEKYGGGGHAGSIP